MDGKKQAPVPALIRPIEIKGFDFKETPLHENLREIMGVVHRKQRLSPELTCAGPDQAD